MGDGFIISQSARAMIIAAGRVDQQISTDQLRGGEIKQLIRDLLRSFGIADADLRIESEVAN